MSRPAHEITAVGTLGSLSSVLSDGQATGLLGGLNAGVASIEAGLLGSGGADAGLKALNAEFDSLKARLLADRPELNTAGLLVGNVNAELKALDAELASIEASLLADQPDLHAAGLLGGGVNAELDSLKVSLLAEPPDLNTPLGTIAGLATQLDLTIPFSKIAGLATQPDLTGVFGSVAIADSISALSSELESLGSKLLADRPLAELLAKQPDLVAFSSDRGGVLDPTTPVVVRGRESAHLMAWLQSRSPSIARAAQIHD